MGNRAVITTKDQDNKLALYLHWNGGRDSVEAFIRYCELKGFRTPTSDPSYAFARLTQVVGNFFGGSSSVGIFATDTDKLDPGDYDNGIYYLDGWEIAERDLPYKGYKEQQEYDLEEILKSIDESQPVKEQLGELLNAKKTPTKDLKIGDNVYILDHTEEYKLGTVIGFGTSEYVNGRKTMGVPFVNLYGSDYSNNCNNYLTNDEYFVKTKSI